MKHGWQPASLRFLSVKSAFSSEGLSVTLERTVDGKAKATVAADGAPPTFFRRVRVR